MNQWLLRSARATQRCIADPMYPWLAAAEGSRILFKAATGAGYGCKFDCDRPRTASRDLPWETDGRYGGWGGSDPRSGRAESPTARTPVVFVHGNGRDACDWRGYHRFLRDGGYGDDELWAITFRRPTSTHEEMADQLDEFVSRVLTHTGRDRVSVVAHSLGVTGARHWMEARDRYDAVEAFVGLAGANHGLVSWWGDLSGRFEYARPLGFLDADRLGEDGHGLTELNRGEETPGDVSYYTIRGRYDPFFSTNPNSPRLDGAVENRTVRRGHEGVRTARRSKRLVYKWLSGAN
ncbi:esterase/lipase family protein [Halegenticoccus soli]|uniref:esterase/lipase family protein n=1 Tax=Halegenticoccus soli TaxID=1985678 RepID=UPI000C6D72F9|nr:alpha/beta fold hydrolase [Halegenticoccus soli]